MPLALGDPPMSPIIVPLVFLAAAVTAGKPDSSRNTAPPVHAIRITVPVNVDGVLDEAAWQSAEPATDFKQRDPVEGGVPSMKTEVRVGYDDDAVYIAARMYDPKPDSILARLSRRDVSVQSDRFGLYLDPYHDKRSGYYFLINAAG